MVKDTVSILSATLLLSYKALNQFNYKRVRKIVSAAYNQVFHRNVKIDPSSLVNPTNNVPTSTLSHFLKKCIEKEHDILIVLGFDLFVPNVYSLLITSVLMPFDPVLIMNAQLDQVPSFTGPSDFIVTSKESIESSSESVEKTDKSSDSREKG